MVKKTLPVWCHAGSSGAEIKTKMKQSFKLNNSFFGKDIISVDQFSSKKEIDFLFFLADKMKQSVEKREARNDLAGFCIAELFYQPSTRTFASFWAAAQRLGASWIIAIPGMESYSSVVKGESLPDTIRTIEQTTAADLIILRHPEDNSSRQAAAVAQIPVVNAGSGKKEHPTQAILDLYTIYQEKGRLDNLNLVFVGDLKNGRTIKSLSCLISIVAPKNKITFVSPPELKAPANLIARLKKKKLVVEETNNLEKTLPAADILYVTRIQKEWFASQKEYLKVKGSYVISPRLMRRAKKETIVMHPLPRVEEINPSFDSDPRAVYFRQMRNGLYVRMALLRAILVKKNEKEN